MLRVVLGRARVEEMGDEIPIEILNESLMMKLEEDLRREGGDDPIPPSIAAPPRPPPPMAPLKVLFYRCNGPRIPLCE